MPVAEGFHVLAPQDVVRCQSDGNYTTFHLSGGEKIIASRTLKEFEERLAPHGFLRVHNSHVVNAALVRMYLNKNGGMLQLANGDEVPVGNSRRAAVQAALGK